MIITTEHLFQHNMQRVCNRVKLDYHNEISEAIATGTAGSFEDWLEQNLQILGEYTFSIMQENFDFDY